MKDFIFKHRIWIVIGIILINFFYRMSSIDLCGLWFDESYSVQLAQKPVSNIIEVSFKEDVNPPFYGIALHYWINFFGKSEAAVRSFSAFSGALAAGLLFLLALNFFNYQTAIFSSVLFLVYNEVFYYSQEARTYTFVLFLVLLSHYIFLSLIKRPHWFIAILLSLINAWIFYTHFLAFLTVIGQIIAFPFMTGAISTLSDEKLTSERKLTFSLKPLLLFAISLLLVTYLLYDYIERLSQIATETGKSVWLFKPTFQEFKTAVYELLNGKLMYQVYIYSVIAFIGILLFKKFREDNTSIRLVIFAIIVGPLLLLLNYYISIYVKPIFLKRYVLFTMIGFIFLYAYLLASIRFNFYIKLILILVFSLFLFKEVKIPRDTYSDYNKVVPILKEIQKYKPGKVLIISDMQDLFSYYFDKKIFSINEYHNKHVALRSRHVYTPFNNTWPKDEDFSDYTHIYYTRTFDAYYDPNGLIFQMLNERYKNLGDIKTYYGIKITHYYNPNHK